MGKKGQRVQNTLGQEHLKLVLFAPGTKPHPGRRNIVSSHCQGSSGNQEQPLFPDVNRVLFPLYHVALTRKMLKIEFE